MTPEASRVIATLRLEPLPDEGGFFRPTWRSAGGSAILFLITEEDFSAFHRIAQDELWHFHAGDPVEHVQLGDAGAEPKVVRLGGDVCAGDSVQLAVPRGAWQGARLAPAHGGPRRGFALLGCTVTPAWDERGFELGHRAALLAGHPAARAWIEALTR